MSRGVLHWLVGPHPWYRRHGIGFAWLGTLLGWLFLAWVFYGVFCYHWRDWNSVAHPPSNATNTLTGAVLGICFLLPTLIAATAALVWRAEERRIKPSADKERAERAQRIAAMERELGIDA